MFMLMGVRRRGAAPRASAKSVYRVAWCSREAGSVTTKLDVCSVSFTWRA